MAHVGKELSKRFSPIPQFKAAGKLPKATIRMIKAKRRASSLSKRAKEARENRTKKFRGGGTRLV